MAASEGLQAAASSGDYGATLRALRDDLAGRLAGCTSDRDAAALSARLVDVLDKLAAVPAPAEGTPLSEFQRRLHARKSAS